MNKEASLASNSKTHTVVFFKTLIILQYAVEMLYTTSHLSYNKINKVYHFIKEKNHNQFYCECEMVEKKKDYYY